MGSGVRWDRGVRWAWQNYPLTNSDSSPVQCTLVHSSQALKFEHHDAAQGKEADVWQGEHEHHCRLVANPACPLPLCSPHSDLTTNTCSHMVPSPDSLGWRLFGSPRAHGTGASQARNDNLQHRKSLAVRQHTNNQHTTHVYATTVSKHRRRPRRRRRLRAVLTDTIGLTPYRVQQPLSPHASFEVDGTKCDGRVQGRSEPYYSVSVGFTSLNRSEQEQVIDLCKQNPVWLGRILNGA